MLSIIIKKAGCFGKSRSEQETNLRQEWGGTMTDEQLDKVRFIEKKIKDQTGSDRSFVGPSEADEIK